MTDDQTVPNRQRFRADGTDVAVRDDIETDDDVFELRMPIASTGAVRNDGDDPLTREEIDGMARQLDERSVGVFPDHGNGDKIAGGRYSPFEKLGEWRAADVNTREDDDQADVLMATARMPDPETLPAATGSYREALAILKEQAKRGIAQDSSIGWREDDSHPGGVDLMEASIVGIGADWRTNTGDEAAEVLAHAAAIGREADDPDGLVATFRAAVTTGRELTDEQVDLVTGLLERFVDSQGDATLSNFSSWLRENDDDIDADELAAAHAAIDEYVEQTTPWDQPVSETIRPWLSDGDDESTNDMTEQDTSDEETDSQEQDGDERADAPEWAQTLIEQQETQTDILQEVAESIREDDEDDDDEDNTEENEGGDDDDDEDDDDEQSAETQDADDDVLADIEATLDEYEDARDAIESGDVTLRDIVAVPDADDDDEEEEETRESDPHELTTKYGVKP